MEAPNIISHHKTFGDVKVDDKLYVIDPTSHNILETTVTASFVHPKSENKAVWVLEIFMPFKLKAVKDESLKAASEYGTRTKDQLFLQKDQFMALLVTEIPTVVATEKKYIEQWMAKQKSLLTLLRKNA